MPNVLLPSPSPLRLTEPPSFAYGAAVIRDGPEIIQKRESLRAAKALLEAREDLVRRQRAKAQPHLLDGNMSTDANVLEDFIAEAFRFDELQRLQQRGGEVGVVYARRARARGARNYVRHYDYRTVYKN